MEQERPNKDEARPERINLDKQTEQRISIGYAILSLGFTKDPNNQLLIFSDYEKQDKQYAVSVEQISQYLSSFNQISQSTILAVDPRCRDAHREVVCDLIRRDFVNIRNNSFIKEQWLMQFLHGVINNEQQEQLKDYSHTLTKLMTYLKGKCFKNIVSVCEAYRKKEDKFLIPSLSELIETQEKREMKKIEKFLEEDYCSF
jgi:hypothetical protein